MKITRPSNFKVQQDEIDYEEVGSSDVIPKEEEKSKPSGKKLRRLAPNQEKEKEVKDEGTDEKAIDEAKEDIVSERQSHKIVDKLVSVPKASPTGTILEMSRGALSLRRKDKNGYHTSMDGKMHFVFSTFNKKTFSQVDKIPCYIDTSTWLGLCKKFSDGELFELDAQSRENAKKNNKKYADSIWQNVGGSHTFSMYTVDRKPLPVVKEEGIACVFRIAPGLGNNSFGLSAEIWPGKPDDTGRMQIISGRKMIKKINIAISWEQLEEWMEMSKVIIQAYYNSVIAKE